MAKDLSELVRVDDIWDTCLELYELESNIHIQRRGKAESTDQLLEKIESPKNCQIFVRWCRSFLALGFNLRE